MDVEKKLALSSRCVGKLKRRSIVQASVAGVKSPGNSSKLRSLRGSITSRTPATTTRSIPCVARTSSSVARPLLNQPLPTRLQNGRASSFATTGVSRPHVTAVPTYRTVARTAVTPASTRSAITRPGTAQRPATAQRPKTEIEKLKEELKLLEGAYQSLEEKFATETEFRRTSEGMVEMLKESNISLKENLSMCKEQIESQKDLIQGLKDQLDTNKSKFEKAESQIIDLVKEVDTKEATLRKLHNDVVDLRGQIRVAIRVRPLLPSEDDSTVAIAFPAVNSISFEQSGKSTQYDFESVFTPVFSQKEVFNSVQELILSCLHGYNVSLIAFGQTGSGKTHTMRGEEDEQSGVIPRSAKFLFENSEKLSALGWKFDFSLRFIEVYNNEAYDLLNNHEKLKIRLAGQDVAIDGISDHPVKKFADLARLLRTADGNRKTAATKCNTQSSRSHAIFQWTVKAHQEATGISSTSVLKLVDLAGSERAKESGVMGDQFKEMTFINKSLSTLQKCISLQKQKASHVPYRESKLTELLKDCLGAGSSKTMVIVNINPASDQLQESKRSIEFAAKMRDTKIGTAAHQRDVSILKPAV